MIVTLDVGNSQVHAGFFQTDGEWIDIKKLIPSSPVILSKNDYIISSSVRHELLNFCEGGQFLRFPKRDDNENFMGMPVHYAKTLGEDRLVQAYLLYKTLPSLGFKSGILIDTGTFTTIDFVSTAHGLSGGYIIPGIEILKSSYSKGEKLFVPDDFDFNSINLENPPHNSQDAMGQGVALMYSSVAKLLAENHQDSFFLITGGQCEKLKGVFSNLVREEQINIDPHFIHKSLFVLAQETILKTESAKGFEL